MVPGDDLGPLERAWRLRGYTTIVDVDLAEAEVVVVDGEVPVLCLPPALYYDPTMREYLHGWGMGNLGYQRLGMIGLMRRIGVYMTPRQMEEAG